MRAVAFFIALVICGSVDAVAPSEFAYRATIDAPAGSGLHALQLSEAMQRAAMTRDLRDVLLFNAAGEALPSVALPPPVTPEAVAVDVPLRALPSDPSTRDAEVADFALRIQKDHGAAVFAIVPMRGSSKPDDPIGGYLLDTRRWHAKQGTLRVAFAADAPDYASRVQLLGSDDLVSWRTLSSGALARSEQFGEAFERNSFAVKALPLFVRLSWPTGPAPRLTAASFEEHASMSALPRAALVVSRIDERTLSIDIPPGLGAEKLHLRIPDNSAARVQLRVSQADQTGGRRRLLLSRRAVEQWPTTGPVRNIYRIERNGVWIESPPLQIPAAVATIRIEAVDGTAFAAAVPSAVAEWRPHRLAFVARPPGPYTLAIGHPDVAAERTLHARSVLPDDDPAGLRLPQARLIVEEGPSATVRTSRDSTEAAWARRLLWMALFVAALILAFMAWRLARQIIVNQQQRAPGSDAQ